MSRLKLAAIAVVTAVAITGPAGAQTSLFGQPAAPEPAAEAPSVAPAPRARPKPRGPVPARALSIANDSTTTVSEIEVTAEGKTARLSRPLAPKAKTSLKLPTLKACLVTVTTSFEGAAEADTTSQDICKDRTIRFTD